MAEWTQLGILKRMLRHELGLASSPAVSPDLDDSFRQAIRFAAEQIGDKFGWPHIKARHVVQLAAGERYQTRPATLDHDAIDRAWVEWQGVPHDVVRGIGPEQFMSLRQGEQHDPIMRFDVRNDLGDTGRGVTLEVWPVPLTSYPLYFEGLRAYPNLVNDEDECPMDAQAVVYWAASLRTKDPEERTRFMTLAMDRLDTKKGNASTARGVVIFGEGCEETYRRRPRMIVVS